MNLILISLQHCFLPDYYQINYNPDYYQINYNTDITVTIYNGIYCSVVKSPVNVFLTTSNHFSNNLIACTC